MTNKTNKLISAMRDNNKSLVKELIESMADEELNTTNKDGWTPLHTACRWGHKDTVISLLEKGADVNTPDNDGDTPLNNARRRGHKDIAILIEEKMKSQKSSEIDIDTLVDKVLSKLIEKLNKI